MIRDQTNNQSMSRRIRGCRSIDDLKRAEASLGRLYDAGVFSPNEFRMFDQMIFTRIAKLERSE